VPSVLEARNLDKETVKSNEKMCKETLSILINYAAELEKRKVTQIIIENHKLTFLPAWERGALDNKTGNELKTGQI
jgi:hypothetical protein